LTNTYKYRSDYLEYPAYHPRKCQFKNRLESIISSTG